MMRTTLLIGLCCALAAPAAANSRPAVAEFGQFCKTTTSLVPCTLDHTPKIANSLTGHSIGIADEFSDLDRRNTWNAPANIQLAETSETPKNLATALKEYIDSLLGKKPAPKPEPKAENPEPANQEPVAAESEAAEPESINEPTKSEIDKALGNLLGERESWGTEPSKSGLQQSSAPPAATGNLALATAEATGDLAKFISLRESWGTMNPKKVEAPLAQGAPSKLKLAKAPAVTEGGPKVIINTPEFPPVPELSLISQADIVRARNALLEERASWGTGPSTASASVTGDLEAYIERRERWGKGPAPKVVEAPLAKGAKSSFATAVVGFSSAESQPVATTNGAGPAPTVGNVATDSISGALQELLDTRESWGTEPTFSTRVLAGDLNAYLARRDAWGTGPKAKIVKAPLAKGASKKLRLTQVQTAAPGGPDVIVNALEERPLPQIADISTDNISTSMKALLAEREGWGTAPSMSGPRFAGDLDRYFTRRDGWGKGAKAKVVKAPLAKGASNKLRLSKVAAPAKGNPPIVHELVARPLPEVSAIPADQIGSAMTALLVERESWGTEPNSSEATVAGDLTAFLTRRDRWGTGPKPRVVKAPLAKGAKRTLKLAANPKPSSDTTPVIVHELEARPLPQVSNISPDTIKSAMQALISTRTGWGTEPSVSGVRFAGNLNRYFARRDGWGKGPKARKVTAPLAKGARRKLRLAKVIAPAEGKPAIVHELEARPLPEVSAIPADQIGSAMNALLAEREGWGKSPSKSSLAYAVGSSSVAYTGDLKGFLAQREHWQSGKASGSGTQVAAISPKSTISDAERTRCSGNLSDLANKRTILFANGSSDLSDSSNKVLDEIAGTIKRCGSISVRVEGHTDSRGAASRNQALSEARALSVLDYLVGAGLDRSKLRSVGYGETKPVASNNSRKSRALNRRIEFTIE